MSTPTVPATRTTTLTVPCTWQRPDDTTEPFTVTIDAATITTETTPVRYVLPGEIAGDIREHDGTLYRECVVAWDFGSGVLPVRADSDLLTDWARHDGGRTLTQAISAATLTQARERADQNLAGLVVIDNGAANSATVWEPCQAPVYAIARHDRSTRPFFVTTNPERFDPDTVVTVPATDAARAHAILRDLHPDYASSSYLNLPWICPAA